MATKIADYGNYVSTRAPRKVLNRHVPPPRARKNSEKPSKDSKKPLHFAAKNWGKTPAGEIEEHRRYNHMTEYYTQQLQTPCSEVNRRWFKRMLLQVSTGADSYERKRDRFYDFSGEDNKDLNNN